MYILTRSLCCLIILNYCLTCDFRRNDDEKLCAYTRNSYNEHSVSCIRANTNVQTRLSCEIDEKDKYCKHTGCINAQLAIHSLIDPVDKLEDYDHATYKITITETKTSNVIIVDNEIVDLSLTNVMTPDKAAFRGDNFLRRKNVINETVITKNVSLTLEPPHHNGLYKTALLKIPNIGEKFFYDICVHLYTANGTRELGVRNLCCDLRKYKIEVERINEVYMAIVIIGVVIVFHLVIVVVTWKCPRSKFETVDELLESLPHKNVEILKQLVLSRQNLIRTKTFEDNLAFENDHETYKASLIEEQEKGHDKSSLRKKIQIITIDEENRKIPYSDRFPTNQSFDYEPNYTDTDDNECMSEPGDSQIYLSVQDLNRKLKLNARNKRFARRYSLFNPDLFVPEILVTPTDDGKASTTQQSTGIFKKKIDGRKQSVFFNPSLFTVETDEMRKKRELEMRRRSTLLTTDFFLTSNGTSFLKPKNAVSVKSLNVDLMDNFDKTRAKIIQEAKRRKSISPYQKALSLQASDSD